MRGDGLAEQRMRCKTFLGKANGGRSHGAEAHGAPPLQRLDPGVRRRRHDRAQEATRDLAAVPLHEIVGCHELGPSAQAAHREDLPALGVIKDDGRYALHTDEVALQHAERNAGRHAGIDGVATRLQDGKSRVRREVVAR